MAKYIVQLRRGTASQWESNDLIPKEGEPVIELDMGNQQHKLKIGDGINKYSDLAYLTAGGDTVTQALTRTASITLDADDWDQVSDKRWCQEVNVIGTEVRSNDKVDLQFDAEQLDIFHEKDLAFVAKNEGGKVTVDCIGQKPQNDYTFQCTVMKMAESMDKIIGNTIATPNPQPDWNQTDPNKADYIKNKPTSFGVSSLSASVSDGVFILTQDNITHTVSIIDGVLTIR